MPAKKVNFPRNNFPSLRALTCIIILQQRRCPPVCWKNETTCLLNKTLWAGNNPVDKVKWSGPVVSYPANTLYIFPYTLYIFYRNNNLSFIFIKLNAFQWEYSTHCVKLYRTYEYPFYGTSRKLSFFSLARNVHYLILKEADMTSLTSCEILDELKKLGIMTSDEMLQYAIEYSAYYSIRTIQLELIKNWFSLLSSFDDSLVPLS